MKKIVKTGKIIKYLTSLYIEIALYLKIQILKKFDKKN